MAREAVLVVCPGRGSYGAAELGYIARHHAGTPLLAAFDSSRSERGVPTVHELDGAAAFTPGIHGKGENSAALIYAAGLLDFLALDSERVQVVAVAGNSMGWYTALACAGAVTPEHGFAIADAMGSISGLGEPGGQLLLTLVGPDWRPEPELRAQVDAAIARVARAQPLHRSIELGGMLLVAGSDAALAALTKALPPLPGPAPLRLAGHGPFHSPMMAESARRGRAVLAADAFGEPVTPLIDGTGRVWRPRASPAERLHDYTFGAQILAPYDFTRSLVVAVKEFAPDRIVLLGPGETLGGAIAQALIAERWLGLADKRAFTRRQNDDPFLVAMNRPEQRALVA
jgi:[acyl-carrier-protein] S-malonyltransferase